MDIPANLLQDVYLWTGFLFYALLFFAEGFINGGAMSLLVAYRPHWVVTFHDHWYLKERVKTPVPWIPPGFSNYYFLHL